MSKATTKQRLTLKQVEEMMQLELDSYPGPWEFVDTPDNQMIQQVLSKTKARPIAALAGVIGMRNEFLLMTHLRNHAKTLLLIAREHVKKQAAYAQMGLVDGVNKIRRSKTLKVKYLNSLREIVGRRMPKNKVGTPLVSDWDLLQATFIEKNEAMNQTLGRGRH